MILYIPSHIMEDVSSYEEKTKKENAIPDLIMEGKEYIGIEIERSRSVIAPYTKEEMNSKENKKTEINLPEECITTLTIMAEEENKSSLSEAATILIFGGLTSEGWYD